MFPFAFRILETISITIQAFMDLIVRNKWQKIILLYSEDVADLVELSEGIKQRVFWSLVLNSFLPLKFMTTSFHFKRSGSP